jgi:stage V sporulation protein G
VKPNKGLIGFASFILNESIYVGSVGIYTKLDGSGYRLTYPTKMLGEKAMNIVHPINKETAEQIELAVSEELKNIYEKSNDNENDRYGQN